MIQIQSADITINSKIDVSGLAKETLSKPVEAALKTLKRDFGFVLCDSERDGIPICLKERAMPMECYELVYCDGAFSLFAGDERGFIYGIYRISREILGVLEFWFWNDQHFKKRESICISPDYAVTGTPFAVRLRGWFINDEVLLSSWSVNRNTEKPWEMAFEALLRCGGNMVIPGTDKNSRIYRKLASDMGLSISHHHAEPLGAEMFARAYPELNPSYAEHGDLFHKLWQEGIEEQKDLHVVWNLGFRGQGDCPFWSSDPQYATDEARGQLISELIQEQYRLVKEKDAHAICCTNLYGETMELYQKGCLDLPEDIIKIWADNGFGKMVSRRQGNHNPRVPALPSVGDGGCHGIYYHVSFYDLQAANHMTILPNSPEFIKRELTEVLERKVRDYWIVNCSNIKPHTFYLGFLSKMWKEGRIDVESYMETYIKDYMGISADESVQAVLNCYHEYFHAAVVYGPHEDDHAGEQFCNHVTRILATQWMKDKNCGAKQFQWAVDSDRLKEQVTWYAEKCRQGAKAYGQLLDHSTETALKLPEQSRMWMEDSLILCAKIYAYCYAGAADFGSAYEYAEAGDYKRAFYYVGKAAKNYRRADDAMREREHGKWNGFYANECLTDIKQTAWVLEGLMAWLRTMDDGPHY
ncbi:MAG: glycosyl hydrolase 115 family protein, partial [Hungatella sp.]